MPQSCDLSAFKVLIFDCYATLVDWETGIYSALHPLQESLNHTKSKGDLIRMFQDVELQLIKENPAMLYSDILAITYDQLARKLGAKDAPGDPEPPTHSHAASSFAASVHVWPPFPDTVRALERLSLLGLNLVILANVDCASFAGTRTVLEQGFRFKEVFTAEEIGSYKPDLRNLRYALQKLEYIANPKEILVVAQSLSADILPARELGLDSVWINRPGAYSGIDGPGIAGKREDKEKLATWNYDNLADFAEAISIAKGH